MQHEVRFGLESNTPLASHVQVVIYILTLFFLFFKDC